MNIRDNQSAAKRPEMVESSETIPKGSRILKSETGNTLTCNDEGKDIVHNQINERFKNFIEVVNKKFKNKFDYSKFIYINVKIKGVIICKEHGDFEQTPDKHIKSKYGCPICYANTRKYSAKLASKKRTNIVKIISKEEFLIKASTKYNNKFTYDLNNYNGLTKNKIKAICPEHKEFYILPHSHLCNNTTTGCPKCGKIKASNSMTKSYSNLIKELHLLYNNKYDYSLNNEINFKNRKSIIKIKCSEHGLFNKKAQKHLAGQYCPKCTTNELIKNNVLVGGYCEKLFIERPELSNIKSYLYYLSINNGEYYKIGITKNSVETRIKSIKSKANSFKYKINNIKIIKFKEYSLYNSFKLEQEILVSFKENRMFTSWSNELFNIDIQKQLSNYFD